MKQLRSVHWRKRVWLVYLAVCAVLTGAYLWFPPLKGNGPLINLLGLSSSIAIAVGIYLHRPRARAAWFLFIVGQFLFFDWRLDEEGRPRPEFELNDPDAAGAKILIAGANFGCGSSREHAAWALGRLAQGS